MTSVCSEVNDTVGETLDAGGDGRFAATRLYHELSVGPGDLDIGVSDHQPEPATSIVQAEMYLRIRVVGNAYVVTPDLQYIANSGFVANRDSVVGGVRAGIES